MNMPMAIRDFQFVDNSNVFIICRHLRDNHVRTSQYILHSNLWPLKWRSMALWHGWKLAGKCTLSICTSGKVLLFSVVCSRYIIVHFMKEARTDKCTYCLLGMWYINIHFMKALTMHILPARITLFNSIGTV